MVTDVALNACQFRVTLCPLLIEVVLAENVIVGATFLRPPHEAEPPIAAIRAPHKIQRTTLAFIREVLRLPVRACANQMPQRARAVAGGPVGEKRLET